MHGEDSHAFKTGEQCIVAGTSAIAQILGQHIVDEFVGLSKGSLYDRLSDSDGQRRQATTWHFVDDPLSRLRRLIDDMRHGHGATGQCVEVGAVECPLAHELCQID